MSESKLSAMSRLRELSGEKLGGMDKLTDLAYGSRKKYQEEQEKKKAEENARAYAEKQARAQAQAEAERAAQTQQQEYLKAYGMQFYRVAQQSRRAAEDAKSKGSTLGNILRAGAADKDTARTKSGDVITTPSAGSGYNSARRERLALEKQADKDAAALEAWNSYLKYHAGENAGKSTDALLAAAKAKGDTSAVSYYTAEAERARRVQEQEAQKSANNERYAAQTQSGKSAAQIYAEAKDAYAKAKDAYDTQSRAHRKAKANAEASAANAIGNFEDTGAGSSAADAAYLRLSGETEKAAKALQEAEQWLAYAKSNRYADYAQQLGSAAAETVIARERERGSAADSYDIGKAVVAEAMAAQGRITGGLNAGAVMASSIIRSDIENRKPKENWTDEEEGIYYLIRQQEGAEAAKEYAYEINDMYAAGKKNALADDAQWWAQKHPGAAMAAATAINITPAGMVDYTSYLAEYLITGRISAKEYMSASGVSSTLAAASAAALNDRSGTINEDIPVIGGKGAGDAAQLASSVITSLATVALYGKGVNAVFFANSAVQGIEDAKAQGLSDKQAILLGTWNGIAEVAGEIFSIENLINMKTTGEIKKLLKQALVQGGIEASEEGFTTVLNTIGDAVIARLSGGTSELERTRQAYIAAGLSYDEAGKQSVKDWINDLAYDVLGGAISGELSAGVRIGASAGLRSLTSYSGGISTRGMSAEVKAVARRDAAQDAIDAASMMQESSAARDYAARMQKKLDSRGHISNYQADMLGEYTADAVKNMNPDELRENKKALYESRSAENKTISELVENSRTKTGLEEAVKLLQSDGKTRSAFQRITGLNLGKGEADVRKALTRAQELTEDATKAVSREYFSKATVDGRAVTVNKATVKDGRVMFSVRDEKGGIEDVSAERLEGNKYISKLMAVMIPTLGADAATAFNMYSYGQDIWQYTAEFKNARDVYGTYGISLEQTKKRAYFSVMRPEQIEAAWTLGSERKSSTGTAETAPRVRGTAGVSYEGGSARGVKLRAADRESFNKAQRQLDEACREIAAATGLHFVLFNGTEDGRINGVYREGGTIYVNIQTTDKSAKMIVGQVLSHELTHFIREYAKEQYEELKRFVIDTLIEADNHTFEEAVAQKQAREPGISYDEAVDEVVADGCEMLLKSSEAIKKLCAENRSLGQKIQEFFAWLVEKLEGVFSDADPTHAEARILSEIKDAQRLWDMGLEAAAMSLKAERGTSRAEQYTAHAVSEARRALENELTAAEELLEAAWETGDADELSAALRARTEAEAKLSEADKQGKAQIETARERAEREAKEARAKAIEEARQGVVKAENELERAYAAGVEILPYYERLLDAERELERMGLAPERIYGEEWDKAIPGIAAERARLVKLLEEKRINLEGYRAQVSADKKAGKMTLTVTAPNGETVRRRVNLKGRAATNALIAELIVEHRHGVTAWSQEAAQKNTADEGGKESFSMEDRTEPYDYSKPFEQQIEDYKKGLIPKYDSLIVGSTPDVFKRIGLLPLPMTYGQGHLAEVLSGNVADHDFGEYKLRKLPEKIKSPIAIIASETHPDTSIVAILDMSHNGKKIISAVEIQKEAVSNWNRIDANALTTVHKRSSAEKMLHNAVVQEGINNTSVYYYDKKKASGILNASELQLLGGKSTTEGYIHSINEDGSKVKNKFDNITESKQFKRWFGDWQKHPEKASKVVNADGTPMVVYHQTENAFTVFDVKHKGAGTSDYGTPFGVFMKPTSANIGLKGNVQMPLYASIRNPLTVQNREELTRYLMQDEEYARLYNEIQSRTPEYQTKIDKAIKDLALYMTEWRKANPGASRSALYDDEGFNKAFEAEDKLTEEWTRLNDETTEKAKSRITALLKEKGFDGVIIEQDKGSYGRSTKAIIALDNTQVKSATDNIGTFDGGNPDTRFSKADAPGQVTIADVRAKDAARVRLEAANADMKKAYLKWAANTERRENALYTEKSIDELYKAFRQATGFIPSSSLTSPRSKEEVTAKIREVSNIMFNNSRDVSGDWYDREFMPRLQELAEDMLENAWQQPDDSLDWARANLKGCVKGKTIKIVNQWAETGDSFAERRARYPDLRLSAEKGTPIDAIWQELSGMMPGVFDEDITSEAEMLDVLQEMLTPPQSVNENTGADYDEILSYTVAKMAETIYATEKKKEAADRGRSEITKLKTALKNRETANQMLWDIIASDAELYDTAVETIDSAADARDTAAMDYKAELAEARRKAAEELKERQLNMNELEDRVAELRAQLAMEEKKTAAEKRRADAAEKKAKAERDRANAADEKARERAQKQLDMAMRAFDRAERALEDYKAQAENAKTLRKIQRAEKSLQTALIENSGKKHIPQPMQVIIGDFLTNLNTIPSTARSKEDSQPRVEYFESLQRVKQVVAYQREYMDSDGEDGSFRFDFPKELTAMIDEHITAVSRAAMQGKARGGTWDVTYMNAAELNNLLDILTIMGTAVASANAMLANAQGETVSAAAEMSVADMARLPEQSKTGRLRRKMTQYLNWDNTVPVYAFRRFGRGGEMVFDGIRRGWGVLADHAMEIIAFTDKLYDEKELKRWESEVHEYELLLKPTGEEAIGGEKKTARITTAQLMSMWALMQRENIDGMQAQGHIFGAGIKLDAFDEGGKTVDQGDNFLITPEDWIKMGADLEKDERAMEVVKALQKYMNTVGTKWGNEISLKRWGINAFTDKNYWPIKTDSVVRETRTADVNNEMSLFRLLNQSFTKKTVKRANNAIVISSAFDDFANHMSDMAKYNALAMPILDAMKWFNYVNLREKNNGGQFATVSVKKAMRLAYGKNAENYFMQFLKDLNGVKEGGKNTADTLLSKGLRNYKVAAVGANLRVVIQQPTSIARAAILIDPKYLVKGVFTKGGYEEMMKHSGLAKWKIGLGFYDVNINRGMREQIKGSSTTADKIREKSTALAGKGDEVTWTAMWNACRAEMAEGGLSGEALMKATANRFEELILKTQVIDSTISRSQNMRSSTSLVNSFTAFMAEPTMTYNMLLDCANDIDRTRRTDGFGAAFERYGGKLTKTMLVYATSAAFTAAAAAIMDAMRDDDDYEKWYDKWLEHFTENFRDNLNPFALVPLVSQAQEIISFGVKLLITGKGAYSSGNMYTQPLIDMATLPAIWKEFYSEDKTELTYYGRMTGWGLAAKTMTIAGQLSGLSIGPAFTELRSTYNLAAGIWNATGAEVTGKELKRVKTYDGGAAANIKYAYQDGYMSAEEAQAELVKTGEEKDPDAAYWRVKSWDTGENKYGSIKAAVDADDQTAYREAMNELASHGVAQRTAESEIRSYIKELYIGTEKKPQQINRSECTAYLVKYAGLEKAEAESLTRQWTAKIVTGISYDASRGGNIYEALGSEELSEKEAVQMLIDYGGYEKTKAEEKVSYWSYTLEHEDTELTQEQYINWSANLRTSGISAEVYGKYAGKKSRLKGTDKDGDGKTDSGSIKVQVLALINGMSLTNAQKDKLYYDAGYKESTINEAPWH